MNPTPQTLAQHAAFVRTLAQSLVAESHAADDVVQDTWLAALERPPRHVANPRAWLGRIVERFAWRRGRSGDRRRRREEAAARPERLEAVDEGLARAEILRRVTDAVLALEEPYRTAVLLRFYEGLEAREIAERTGAPLTTVRSRLQRALARLRERLDREHGGDRRVWCEGLVSLLGGNRLADIGAGGAAGATGASATLGAGAGVATMSVMAKTAVGAAAAASVGFLLWRTVGLDPDRPASSAGARSAESALVAPIDGGASGQAREDPASTAPAGERQALAAAATDPVAERGALAVRVTWARDGRPAAGEELDFIAWRHASGHRALHGIADEEGRFRLEGLLPGKIAVGTSHGAGGSAEIEAGKTTTVELEIPKGFAVRGRVVDAAGQPVASARLWLSTYFNHENGSVVGATRPDGTFELLDVPEARYLGAVADGHAPSHLHLLADHQGADEPLGDVELVLTLNGEGGGLEVGLTAPGGGPVTGALVRVAGQRPAGLRIGNLWLSDIPTFEAWSDAYGCASIDGLPPGNAEVTVYALEMGVWKGSALIEAGRTASLSIGLQREGVVAGTVRTSAGEPAEDVSVYLDEEYDPLRPSTKSGTGGRYELRGLPLGELSLKAAASELGSATAFVRIEPGLAATWDPVLSAGRVLNGRVVDHEGAPLAGWTVEAQVGTHSSWRAQAVTDAQGAFRMVDVKPESLVLELYRDVFQEHIPTLRRNVGDEEDDLCLRVERADLCDARLTGRFLDPLGRPIARARIALWAIGASSAPSFETDSQGVLRAERLRPGTYELSAEFPEHPTLFLGRVTIAPAEEHDLGTIALEAPGTLRITVSGRSPAESDEFGSFSLLQIDDEGHSRWAAYVERVRSGEGVVLHPGRYVLQANGKPGVANERAQLELGSGEDRTLDLSPRAGRYVLAGAEVPAGTPIPDWVRTVVRDGAGNVLQQCTTCQAFERRYTHFLQLVPGTYDFEAEASDGRRAHGGFQVDLQGGPEPIEWYAPLR